VLGNYDLAELDLDRLVTQLTDIPSRQLRARAASMREAHRGTLPRLCAAVIVERYNSARGGGRLEDFLARVPSTTKAGITYNRGRRRRAEIRRWAQRNGYDLTGQRSIPPSVRRAYEEAQVAATAKAPDPIAGAIQDTGDATGSVGDSAAAADHYRVGLVDEIDEHTREQIMHAYTDGATAAWVKNHLQHQLRHRSSASRRRRLTTAALGGRAAATSNRAQEAGKCRPAVLHH
jgi:hypothetical protein